ncbi:MAG: SDR family oxidoreductase [Anaerolineales bacterium]|nr:SDR family oxidoreductase [Anaerolineales bacterium]
MTEQNKVALIAGAAGGLGQVVTRQLAEAGFSLALLGRNQERLDALLADLNLNPSDHFTQSVDLTNPDSLNAIAPAIREKYGRLDLLINLVGGWAGGETLLEVQADTVETMLNQHLWSSFYLTQVFLPLLKENGFGRVITVSSPSATNPPPKTGAYAIGKAAQDALMLTLAAELAGSGVTANIIQVKAIDVKHRRQTDTTGKYTSWTTPEEIVSAVMYLASDEAAHLNGLRLPLYG